MKERNYVRWNFNFLSCVPQTIPNKVFKFLRNFPFAIDLAGNMSFADSFFKLNGETKLNLSFSKSFYPLARCCIELEVLQY